MLGLAGTPVAMWSTRARGLPEKAESSSEGPRPETRWRLFVSDLKGLLLHDSPPFVPCWGSGCLGSGGCPKLRYSGSSQLEPPPLLMDVVGLIPQHFFYNGLVSVWINDISIHVEQHYCCCRSNVYCGEYCFHYYVAAFLQ